LRCAVAMIILILCVPTALDAHTRTRARTTHNLACCGGVVVVDPPPPVRRPFPLLVLRPRRSNQTPAAAAAAAVATRFTRGSVYTRARGGRGVNEWLLWRDQRARGYAAPFLLLLLLPHTPGRPARTTHRLHRRFCVIILLLLLLLLLFGIGPTPHGDGLNIFSPVHVRRAARPNPLHILYAGISSRQERMWCFHRPDPNKFQYYDVLGVDGGL